jgi:hypothetical protein
MKKVLLFLLLSIPMFGRAVYSNWCQDGNQQILVSGILSSATTPVQRSYQACTVTVYLANGSTLASIYSDNMGTAKANPFTLSGSNGRYSFYADSAIYVVRHSGTGITNPFTFPIFMPFDGGGGAGGITSLNGLTAATQVFATGTAGSDFGIVSGTATHTFNLPTASSSNRGLLSTTDWSAFNAKAPAFSVSAPITYSANVIGLTAPLTIAQGGTNAITKVLAFNSLSPTTTKGDVIVNNGTDNIRVAVGSDGLCFQADSSQAGGVNWLTCGLANTVPNGMTGGTSFTGLIQGHGTSPFTAITDATSAFQLLRLKANQTSVTYEFASPPYSVSSDYAFTQSPSGTLTATVGASVTLTPCPVGVNGADTGHYVYIGAVGTPEAVLITGGSCVSAATTGTLTFTPANSHSAGFTITSATGGLQEAICALPSLTNEINVPRGTLTLNANVSYCGKTAVILNLSNGLTLAGTGVLPNNSSGTFLTDYRNSYSTGTGRLPLFSQTASVTVASSTSELTLIGAGQGSATLPVNFFFPGKVLRIKLWGIHSAVMTPNITVKIKIGGTTVFTTGVIATGNSTNQVVSLEAYVTCRTDGATGTIIGQAEWIEDGNTSFSMANTTTTTVNTTIANAVDITFQWGTSSASDTITATNVTLENSF